MKYTMEGSSLNHIHLWNPVAESDEFVAFHVKDYSQMNDRMDIHVMSGQPLTANLGIYLDRDKLPVNWQQCDNLLVVLVKDGMSVLAQEMDSVFVPTTRVEWVDRFGKTQQVVNAPLEFGLGCNVMTGTPTAGKNVWYPGVSKRLVNDASGVDEITPMHEWA